MIYELTNLLLPSSGDLTLDSGDDDGTIVVKLPQNPLPQDGDNFTLQLLTPDGHAATLGDQSSCSVKVNNNVGEYN